MNIANIISSNWVKAVIAGVLFFLIDLIWIGYLGKEAYARQIQAVQGAPMQARTHVMPLIYLVIGLGIVYLVQPRVTSSLTKENNGKELDLFLMSMLWGGLLGLIAYAVFDLTNYAILKAWDPVLALKDTVWGTVLTGLTTYLLFKIM